MIYSLNAAILIICTIITGIIGWKFWNIGIQPMEQKKTITYDDMFALVTIFIDFVICLFQGPKFDEFY